MSDQPEKFEAISASITDEQKAKLKSLFPETFTEDGKIDFERLKLTLGEAVDAGKERFGMNWPGKAECFKTIQRPSMATLVPVRDESVNFDSSENLIIEGDNLETLKLLQKAYLGKVKMIFIDPPYNTGNDFIYPDDYSESLDTYLRYTGQVDDGGRKYSTNTDTDGRFHSKWMNMLYPRLFLARNLLHNDGLVFISIDGNEVDNLLKLCDEIFGEENFVELITWKNKYGAGAKTKGFITLHEFVVCYSKTNITNIEAPLDEEQIANYNKKDSKYSVRGGFVTQPLATTSLGERPNLRFPIIHNGQEIWPEKQWVWSKDRVLRAQADDELVITESNGKYSVRVKHYLRDENGVMRKGKPLSVLNGPFTQEGTTELFELFGETIFDFPKPSSLIRYFASFVINELEDKNAIVLDFFAGSGTTGQAVLDLNQQDGGNRKFILVQLPEPTERKDFPTIADITKERIRRVIKKINDAEASQLLLKGDKKQSRGFKVFKLQSSNFKAWNAEQPKDDAELGKQLSLHVDHLVAGRTQDDVLYELLLKSGFPLDTKVEKISLAEKNVFSIAEGAMLICLEMELTPEVIKAMAEKKPERVVCLDAGFANNDQLKTNAVQTMKAKGVTKFQTV